MALSRKSGALVVAWSGCLFAAYLITGGGVAATPLERAGQAPAAATNANVDVQTVHYPSGSATVDAYMAKPTTGGKHAAVLVIHDDLGLNEPIQNVARLLAGEGFVALAPNMLSHSGMAPPQQGRGRGSPVTRLPLTQTLEDTRAAYAFLQKDASVDATKISAVGFGWGGYRVWKIAEQTPALHRAVVFYGVTPTDDQLASITVPVLGHYAQYDFLNTASVLKTQKQLGKKFTYYIYPADRGFFGGSSGSLADITALTGEGAAAVSETPSSARGGKAPASAANNAKLAWTRTLAFLKS